MVRSEQLNGSGEFFQHDCNTQQNEQTKLNHLDFKAALDVKIVEWINAIEGLEEQHRKEILREFHHEKIRSWNTLMCIDDVSALKLSLGAKSLLSKAFEKITEEQEYHPQDIEVRHKPGSRSS